MRALDWLILLGTLAVVARIVYVQQDRAALPWEWWSRNRRAGNRRFRAVQLRLPRALLPSEATDGASLPKRAAARSPNWWHGLGLTAVVSSLLVWTEQRDRGIVESHADIVALWLLSIIAAILAIWQPDLRTFPAQLRVWSAARRLDLAIVGGLTALAAVPSFIMLDSYPWAFNGDEGAFTMNVKAILDGHPVNPFGTGWMAHPNLFFYLQAAAMAVIGETVSGARTVSAVFGVLAVPLAYALVARLFDRPTGLIAAVLLGTFHVHLYWSRDALNNGASTFFVLVVILLLSIALQDRAPVAFLLTGIAAGFAQYFYLGNRVLLIVLGLILTIDFAIRVVRPSLSRTLVVRTVGHGLLVVAGAFLVILPLVAHYTRFPDEVNARQQQVSIFATGWYDLQRDAGRSTVAILLGQFRDAALIPFSTDISGQYRGETPFIGWPYAIPALIGLVIAMTKFRQERFRLIALPYWAFAASMVAIIPPMATNRFVATTPLICIFAAIAISASINTLCLRLRLAPPLGLVIAGATVAIVSIWSLHYYFRDPNQVAINSDPNTQVSEHLARDILAIDPSATVFFAAPPRMWYDGFPNLVFRTPEATGISLNEPWTAQSDRPILTVTTIFAFLPERRGELDVIRQWYPGGEVVERTSDKVGPLYTLYVLRRPPLAEGS